VADPPRNLTFDFEEDDLKSALKAERQVEPGDNLRASWDALLKEAGACSRCDLYKCATQTVFGEGPLDASIVFVGEAPGD
jgi:DNA polymerase